MSAALLALALATAVACGLSGGVFFAFSSFVMPALRALPPAQALAAMQQINAKALTPPFMTLFGGSTLLALASAAAGALYLDDPYGPWLVAAGALHLTGSFALTAAFHVPRNDALARLDTDGPQNATAWRTYATGWTRANHVRALTDAAACACAAAALAA